MKQCVVRRIIYLRKNRIFNQQISESFLFSEKLQIVRPHGFATDVWSLGILIATLLTGHPPFDTDSMLIGTLFCVY